MVRLINFIFHRCNMSGDAPITSCLIFAGVMCHVSTFDIRRDVTLIWLFPLHIKTTQTFFNHIMVRLKNFIFHRYNMSGDAPITPCSFFIGVICHVSTEIFRFSYFQISKKIRCLLTVVR